MSNFNYRPPNDLIPEALSSQNEKNELDYLISPKMKRKHFKMLLAILSQTNVNSAVIHKSLDKY